MAAGRPRASLAFRGLSNLENSAPLPVRMLRRGFTSACIHAYLPALPEGCPVSIQGTFTFPLLAPFL